MKTLADLKRAIKPGTKLEIVDHWMPGRAGHIRIVTKTQGNGYYFNTTEHGDKRLWGDYPTSAKRVTFPAPDTFRVEEPPNTSPHGRREVAHWTIRILPADPGVNLIVETRRDLQQN